MKTYTIPIDTVRKIFDGHYCWHVTASDPEEAKMLLEESLEQHKLQHERDFPSQEVDFSPRYDLIEEEDAEEDDGDVETTVVSDYSR